MFHNELDFRIRYAPEWGAYAMYLTGKDDDGKIKVLKNLLYVPIEPGHIPEPTLTLDDRTAQRLMDELWKEGIRPKHGHGTAGQLDAAQRHLEDMRHIAFSKLQIPLPIK